MTWVSIFIWLPIWFLVWVELDPESVRKAANGLRLWWRGIVVRKVGTERMKEVRQQFYKMARKTGYPQEKFVPEFTAREQELIEYFGNRYINLYKPWLNKEI